MPAQERTLVAPLTKAQYAQLLAHRGGRRTAQGARRVAARGQQAYTATRTHLREASRNRLIAYGAGATAVLGLGWWALRRKSTGDGASIGSAQGTVYGPERWGPRWKTQRPPGLPPGARETWDRASSVDALRTALSNDEPAFQRLMMSMAAKESGSRVGRPADRYDGNNIRAFGIFQWNSLAVKEPKLRTADGLVDAPYRVVRDPVEWSVEEEINGPLAAYRALYNAVRRRGGSPLAAGRAVHLWQHTPSGARNYYQYAANGDWGGAWNRVSYRGKATVDRHVRSAGLSGIGVYSHDAASTMDLRRPEDYDNLAGLAMPAPIQYLPPSVQRKQHPFGPGLQLPAQAPPQTAGNLVRTVSFTAAGGLAGWLGAQRYDAQVPWLWGAGGAAAGFLGSRIAQRMLGSFGLGTVAFGDQRDPWNQPCPANMTLERYRDYKATSHGGASPCRATGSLKAAIDADNRRRREAHRQKLEEEAHAHRQKIEGEARAHRQQPRRVIPSHGNMGQRRPSAVPGSAALRPPGRDRAPLQARKDGFPYVKVGAQAGNILGMWYGYKRSTRDGEFKGAGDWMNVVLWGIAGATGGLLSGLVVSAIYGGELKYRAPPRGRLVRQLAGLSGRGSRTGRPKEQVVVRPLVWAAA